MASAQADRTESTPEQRMLHGSATPDFLDSAHEWRRLFAEAGAHSSSSSSPLAPGLSVLGAAAR